MRKRIRDFFFPDERVPLLEMCFIAIAFSVYVLLAEAGLILFLHMQNSNPDLVEVSYVDIMIPLEFEAFLYETTKNESIVTNSNLVQVPEEKSQLDIALSFDYFKGSSNNEKDLDKAVRTAKKSIVHLYDSKFRTNGSGFIYEIDEDYIYVVTNYHVAQHMLEYCQVFFDDFPPVRAEFVGRDDFYDVALLRVSTEQLSDPRLLLLREVSINETVLSRIHQDADVFMTVEYQEEEAFFDQGKFTQEFAQIPSLPQTYTITTLESKPGASGSGIFDFYGNLVAMNYGRYWPEGEGQYQNICVPLVYVIESVEEIITTIE
jgi:hypothetical protein